MVSGILKAVSKQTGLVYDTKRNIVHGNSQGYLVAIKETDQRQIIVTVSAKSSTNENQTTEEFLNGLRQTIPQIKQVIPSENSIRAIIKIGIYKKAIGITLNTLSQMVSYCKNSNMVSCCENCGSEIGVEVVSIDGTPSILCDACTKNVISSIDETRANIKKKKGNFVGGLVGAFLGSLIGVVVWVLIYQLGYIAAISGLVFSICAIKGYEKFGGKLNVLGIISSLVIAIGMLYVAENISLAIEIHREIAIEGYDATFFDSYRAIGQFMAEPEVRTSVIGDLAGGYLLMAIASISPIIQMFKESNHIIEVTKLSQKENQGPSL